MPQTRGVQVVVPQLLQTARLHARQVARTICPRQIRAKTDQLRVQLHRVLGLLPLDDPAVAKGQPQLTPQVRQRRRRVGAIIQQRLPILNLLHLRRAPVTLDPQRQVLLHRRPVAAQLRVQ